MASKYDVIGGRAPRLDAPAKATGQAEFTADLVMPGMLHGVLVQSPHAHAGIKRIDLSRARRMKKVHAAICHKEAGAVKYGVSPARYDETLFAVDKVRYVGDEVAAVAAEDLESAYEAASRIKVDYEVLPHVLDPYAAQVEGAPLIHEDFSKNICAEVHQEFGDVDAALKKCHLVRKDRFVNKMQDAAFLEPNCALAHYDHHGMLTLHTSTQVPHYVQRTVSMVTGVPMSRVRVIKPYVGGGFGPKAAATPLDLAACVLAMKTGRPVRMAYTREQVFLFSRARHQFFHEMETGVDKDGSIVALRHRCTLDGGAYSSFGIATVYYAGSLLGGPYKLQHMKYDGVRVYTNKPACGAQRGHGGVAARACFEQQLDLIAAELGMDPVELRLKNIMETGDTTCNDLNMSSLGMRECLEAVSQSGLWKKKGSKDLPPGCGVGVACGFFVSGAGYPIYRSETPHATMLCKVLEDGGGVKLLSGSAEIGQGSDTTFAMIAAEALGISLEDVRIESGDTDFSVDLGAYSSRQTLMTGHAAKQAAEDAKRQILAAVAGELGVEAKRLDFKKGLMTVKGGPVDFTQLRTKYIREHRGWAEQPGGKGFTFAEAARIAYLKKGSITGHGSYKPPVLGGKYKGAAVGTSPAYGCSAQAALVKVDTRTGQVRVLELVGAHDCGKAINMTSVEAQMQGSYSMGLGEAMFEEVKFDDQGRILNPSLGEYHIPTSLDMPKVGCKVIESNEPNGPFGAKEVGEGAIMPTIPAILNAVRDAVGVTIEELPITPERVLGALDKNKSN